MSDGILLETLYSYPPPTALSPESAQLVLDQAFPVVSQNRGLFSMYIHIPFCLHFCRFCGFIKHPYKAASKKKYLAALVAEINLLSQRVSKDLELSAIYFGGGTASTLNVHEVDAILSAIKTGFSCSRGIELTFEGEALTLSEDGYLEAMAELGFTRLSFGVQVADANARKALNLRPTIEVLASLSNRASALFDDVCIDYMYGWPGFSAAQTVEDLELVLRVMSPSSVELFQFEMLDASPALVQSFRSMGFGLPAVEDHISNVVALEGALQKAGYCRYSYTVFGRPGGGLPNYYSSYYGWQDADVLGVGVGAQTFYRGTMLGAVADLERYCATILSGNLAYDAAAQYSKPGKELITWPRRGWISREFVERHAPGDYLAKIDGLLQLQALSETSGMIRLADYSWSLVPILMDYLLNDKDRLDVRAVSLNRAIERGLVQEKHHAI